MNKEELSIVNEETMHPQDVNFFNLFNSAPDLLFVLDMNGNILLVNDTAIRRLGYAREELVGNNVLTVHPVERRAEAAEIVQRMIQGQADHCPIPILTKEGNVIPVETRVVPGRWDHRDVLFGVCKDISALKLSEEKFSKTFHSTAALMALSTFEDGRLIDVNDTFLATLGFSREEVIGRTTTELNLFDASSFRNGAVKELVKRGNLRNYEIRVRDKKGNLLFGLFSAEVIHIQDTLCLISTMIDITERKRIEMALLESEQNFRNLFLNNPVPMALNALPHAEFTDVNEAFLATLGYAREEVIGRTCDDLGLFVDPDRHKAVSERLLKERRIDNVELQVRRKDGDIRDGFFSGELVGTHGSLRMLTAMIDMTDRKRAEQELRRSQRALVESEERFRSIFDHSLDGMMLTLPTGYILVANRAAQEILGRTEEELCLAGRDGVVQRDEKLARALEERKEKGEWRGELTYLRKDERSFPVEVSSNQFQSQDGLNMTCIIFRDITGRKQAERELEENRQKYHQLFEMESDALILLDRETHQILDVNKSAMDLYGYTREELLGMKSIDLSAEPEKTHDAIREGTVEIPIRWHRKKSGEVFPAEITGTYFPLGGRAVHLAAVRDNTDRVRMEQALRDSEERWKFALEGSGDGIWDWDATTNHVYYSKQWKTMLGYSEQEIGNTLDEWDSRVHPDDKAAAYADIGRHFRGETEIYQNEHRVLCKDGSYKWILDRGKVIEWMEDKKPRRIIGTHSDITERKRTEEELTSHRERLEELVKERTKELESKTQSLQEFNAALKVLLQQRDDDKKDLENRYSSNIRNLLLPYVEKLKKSRLDERQKSYVEIMETHFNEIISPLLKNLQQFNLTPTEVQVASLIRNGKSTKEIAEMLMVATGTIDNHRKSIRKKLGLKKMRSNLQMKLKSIEE